MRADNSESIRGARREAAADVDLMMFAVQRKVRQEEERRGLVILKAVYGRLPAPLPAEADVAPPPTARRSSLTADQEWPGVEEDDCGFLVVTSPVQYLAEDSKLQLFNSSKSGLPGFCDPCPGEDKVLYVLYRFKGFLHEVCIPDQAPLSIPLKRDKLPEQGTSAALSAHTHGARTVRRDPVPPAALFAHTTGRLTTYVTCMGAAAKAARTVNGVRLMQSAAGTQAGARAASGGSARPSSAQSGGWGAGS